jgi:hypothetical protein
MELSPNRKIDMSITREQVINGVSIGVGVCATVTAGTALLVLTGSPTGLLGLMNGIGRFGLSYAAADAAENAAKRRLRAVFIDRNPVIF